jgi:hypothetical protein
MLIEPPIVYGNSGGPVLNHENKVVGIAAKGPPSLADAQRTEKFEVIPLSTLLTVCPPCRPNNSVGNPPEEDPE